MNTITLSMKNFDRLLLTAVIMLTIIGTVMLYSASSSLSMAETSGRTDTLFLQQHLKRILAGIIVLFACIFVDYRTLKRFAPWLMYGSIALLLLTKVIFLAKGIHAPARWLYLGSLSIQTSDIARLSLIIYLAAYLDYKRDHIKDFYNGFVPPVIVIGILFVLIVLQPDFSTAMMFGIITAVMLFMGGARMPHLLATGTSALAVALPVMMAMPYRRARVMAWLYGTDDGSIGYQVTQSLISLGNGGFFGLGLGNSMEKNFFLPTPHTDFIFSIIGEEIGLIGTVFILTLFLLIFQRGIKIAKDCTDPFGIFLSLGIAFNLVLYAFINAAVTTNIFPVTGLPMPLISYGGSTMITNFAAIGILLNISQSRRVVSRPTTMKRVKR